MTIGELFTSIWNTSVLEFFAFMIFMVIMLGLLSGLLSLIEFVFRKLTKVKNKNILED